MPFSLIVDLPVLTSKYKKWTLVQALDYEQQVLEQWILEQWVLEQWILEQ